MKIEIETSYDSVECETCGGNYAEGGVVKVDGVEILNYPAEASCYGGGSYSESELLVMALKKLGHEVIVDGSPFTLPVSIWIIMDQKQDSPGKSKNKMTAKEAMAWTKEKYAETIAYLGSVDR